MFFILVLSFLVNACIYEFSPKVADKDLYNLVVEGDIIAGGTSDFSFTLVSPLSAKLQPPMQITPLTLRIESEDGNIYYPAAYSKTRINTNTIDVSKRHRLVFTFKDRETGNPIIYTYNSNWVHCIQTPKIDSLYFTIAKDSLHLTVRVSTHSEIDSLKYFRWQYVEDWEIKSSFQATYKYNVPFPDDRGINPLTCIQKIDFENENRYYCWVNFPSTELLLDNSVMLRENVINQFPVKEISNIDSRLSCLYSIEVVQRALSKEGYEYWSAIKRNSDEVGGIFSPQPTEVRGNISCVEDPNEIVLGYIGGCTLERKRMFIDSKQSKIYSIPRKDCDYQDVAPSLWFTFYRNGYDIVNFDELAGNAGWARKSCVDCRTVGTKNKPYFWPNDHK